MKVIVTGATGFIGKQVVKQCINSPDISSVILLSRNPVPKSLRRKKVHVIRHHDFLSYSPELLEQLKGSQCCIWCLGHARPYVLPVETARKINVEYPLAAARAFVAIAPEGQKFHFVFCSVRGAQWDPSRELPRYSNEREAKGAAERGLQDLAEATPETFGAIVLRPGNVLSDKDIDRPFPGLHALPKMAVSVLARAFVGICLEPPIEPVIEHHDIEWWGGEDGDEDESD